MSTDLFSSIPSTNDEARIQVDCTRRADHPLNRLLFGKFTEHLGRNIYNGMWAQILQNSSFADWSYFSPMWNRAQSRHATEFPLDRMLAAYERGLACWWLPYGSASATYLIDWVEPFNSATSQRIEVPAAAPETGIAQAIYLPAHRMHSYTASFHARGKTNSLHISLIEEHTGATLASATVEGIDSEWKSFSAQLTIPEESLAPGTRVEFRIGLVDGSRIWLDQVFLFPDDHISGFDPDIIHLLKESKLPLLRYPGGNFVSGYHWIDGIGPLHQRQVRANPAWATIESNHVGTDEFMAFCRAVDCEPMICVNAGNGTPEEAAGWVEYCNGNTATPNGAQRAENGHPEPYDVRFWEIGNEIYGGWQIGHCTAEEYAERYTAFRRAMLAVEPDIQLIANGQTLDWNRPLVERKGDQVRSLSLHTLIGGQAREEQDPEAVYRALMAYTTRYDEQLQQLRDQASTTIADASIAITELQVFTNVPHLPTNATQTESLFLAGIIHSALRQDNLVEMITHSALVNHGGGLRKEREIAYANPVHWVSHLYGNLPAAFVVRSIVEGPTFAAAIEGIATGEDFPVLDVVATLSAAEDQLILLVINRHPCESVSTTIEIEGFTPASQAEVQSVSGDGYMAKNTWEEPDAVRLERSLIAVDGTAPQLTFAPHSVTALTLVRRTH